MPGRRARSKFWSMEGQHKSLKVRFESGLEKRFLDQCYMLGIKVERCDIIVPYKDSTGKWHQYHPDFNLPEYRYVVEIKGSWAFRDNHGFVAEKFRAAMVKFDGRYTIITEKELKTDFVSKLIKSLLEEKRLGNRL